MRKLWLWWHIRNCKQNWKINLRLYLYLFGTGMEDQLNFNGWFTRSSVPRRATFFDGQKQTWSRGRVMITWYINFKSSSNPDRKCLQKRTIIVSIFWIDRSPWNEPNPVFTVIYKSALVIIHLFYIFCTTVTYLVGYLNDQNGQSSHQHPRKVILFPLVASMLETKCVGDKFEMLMTD